MVSISPNEVAVADVAASRIIHSVKDGFPKGDWYMKLAPLLTDEVVAGMFSMLELNPNRVRRRLVSQGFSKSTILKWEEPIQARMRTAVAKIHREALAGSADILKWWTLMANDVACELFFGEDFDALGGEKKAPFIKDCEISMIIGGISAEFHALIPILFRLRAVGEIAIQNTCASSGEKLQLPESAISQEASNITIAGTDTTAIVLTYLVWAVLKRPAVRQKLQAEVADPNLPPDPTGKELERLPYLNRVIEETLRLYTPISQSLPRTVPVAGATLSGYALPPGMTVSTQAYTFYCDPSVYADALAFSPDRWLHPAKEMKDAFFAWGAGSRGCLGTHIARLELMHATYMVFRICGDARIVEETMTEQRMAYADFFIIAPYGGQV